MGACYEVGLVINQDFMEARRLYSSAAVQGHRPAIKNLYLLDEKVRTDCPLLGKQVVISGTAQEDLNGTRRQRTPGAPEVPRENDHEALPPFLRNVEVIERQESGILCG